MPQNKSLIIPAPRGIDASALPALLPPERSSRIVNMRADRAGRLRACLRLSDVCELPAVPDGLSYYYGETAEDDRLLIVAGGTLYAGVPVNTTVTPWTWDVEPAGGGFAVGKRVRSVSYQQETFFVQEDGLQPLRYDGTGLYQLGISPPENAPGVSPMTPSSGTGNKTGSVRYYYSYFDSRSRESDLSDYTELDYADFPGYAGGITIDYGVDPQVVGAYIYATTPGQVTIRYRIATLYKALDELMWEDNAASTSVDDGAQAPLAGQFALPNPASHIAVHKRHIILNDIDNPDILQINNIGAPTQWATVTTAATDGARVQIGTHQGAGIHALLTVGTLLFVSTRAEVLTMWGESTTGSSAFSLRSLQNSLGVLAPDSWQFCNNAAIGLMQDGKVWMSGGADAFLFHELSGEIDRFLREHTTEQKERAVARWSNNIYILTIGERGYCYDFTAKGWFLLEGLHTNSIVVPVASVLSDGGALSTGGGGGGGGGGGVVDVNSPDFELPDLPIGNGGGRIIGGETITPIGGEPFGGGPSLDFEPVEEPDV